MTFRVSMGQYVAGTSCVHRLDPRAKIAGAIVVSCAGFLVSNAPQLALAMGFVLVAIALSRVGVGRVLASMRPILAMLVFLGLANLLVVRRGGIVWQAGPICVTEVGLSSAILFPLRMAVGVAAFALLLLTTTPSQLTDAFDSFTAPLSRMGLPGHELAMVFSLMLRFVPTLADEASAAIDAQAIRGAGLGEGGIVRRVRSVVPVVTSLMASSLRHADSLSRALDARCYEGGAARSHWHPLTFGVLDAVAVALCVLLGAGILALS